MKYSDICNADSALQKGTLPQENGGFGGGGGETIEEKLYSVIGALVKRNVFLWSLVASCRKE